MNRSVIAGAWYGDYLTTGQWVATIPGAAVATHLGPIRLPAGESWGLVTPRCTNFGGFRFAGQSHDIVGVTWEWTSTWEQRGPTNGVNGAIYDMQGVLHRAGPETSQGYRYVAYSSQPAGRLVLGDATYGPVHGLNEYTDLSPSQDGSFLIGQGNPDAGAPSEGLYVWTGTRLRPIETGSCRFVNAHLSLDKVTVAFTGGEGVILLYGPIEDFLGYVPPPIWWKVPGPIVPEQPE